MFFPSETLRCGQRVLPKPNHSMHLSTPLPLFQDIPTQSQYPNRPRIHTDWKHNLSTHKDDTNQPNDPPPNETTTPQIIHRPHTHTLPTNQPTIASFHDYILTLQHWERELITLHTIHSNLESLFATLHSKLIIATDGSANEGIGSFGGTIGSQLVQRPDSFHRR